MTTIDAGTSGTGDAYEGRLFYAVRGEHVATCRALGWAWTSIRPYVLAYGPALDTVQEQAVQRAGHDDVSLFRKGHERP